MYCLKSEGITVRPVFLIVDLREFFSDLGSEGQKIK